MRPDLRHHIDSGHRISCRITQAWVLLLLCLPIVGCDGCRRTDEAEDPDKPTEPEIETGILRSMPTHADSPLSYVKPTHWSAAYQDFKSTRQDYRGVLSTEPLRLGQGAFSADGSDHGFVFSRPATMVKGQQKRFDLQFYAPAFADESKPALALRSSFSTRQGVLYEGIPTRINRMPAHQYFFVVLTSRPAELSYIGDDDWQRMRSDELTDGEQNVHYRVVAPSTDGVIPIPDSFLQWTSIAYVLWDDLSPEVLTPDQQQAMLDWVHWGGRVIVNGPAAAASFRGSMLESILPITAADSTELTGSQISSVVRQWQIPDGNDESKSADSTLTVIEQLEGIDSMPGAGGAMQPGAHGVHGTDELVVEKLSGRGNVVLTRFDLTSGWLRKWVSASGFYNGALLRRPARDYQSLQFGVQTVFADDLEQHTRNAQLVSGLRILSRDTSLASSSADAIQDSRSSVILPPSWISNRFDAHVIGGVAAWNQKSGVATASRNMLQESAGISIPPARFVATSLMWYLAILVPANYLIFRLLGRLEWAWIAVPVIATGGAVWIARQAQLDIGFARSRSEIALLELQPDHDRGHLTRYVALYNSLSTTYNVDFDTREGLLTPLSMGNESTDSANRRIEFRYGFNAGVQVSGINVPSNKTQLLHTEQMTSLGGAVSFSGDQTSLTNDTLLELDDVTIVRTNQNDELEFSPLGPLTPGETVRLEFQPAGTRIELGRDVPAATAELMRLVLAEGHLPQGEVRLIARMASSLPGCQIVPTASQTQAETVVHATLAYARLPAARPDRRIRPEVQVQGEDFDEEMAERGPE